MLYNCIRSVIRGIKEVPVGHLGGGMVRFPPVIIELGGETGETDIIRDPLVGPSGGFVLGDSRPVIVNVVRILLAVKSPDMQAVPCGSLPLFGGPGT